jgi:hypothetical protein
VKNVIKPEKRKALDFFENRSAFSKTVQLFIPPLTLVPFYELQRLE